MNRVFVEAFRRCLEDLVQDLRYLHPPTGNMVAPRIIDVMLPRPLSLIHI